MEGRVCPQCSTVWHSSGWQGPERKRCECGAALNLEEAQFDRVLVDECQAVADDLRVYLEARKIT